jgi:predicted amidohydrolase
MKVAAAQIDIEFANPEANLARMIQLMEQLGAQGVDLIAFPECALTGYCFDSRAAGLAVAETIPGPATDRLAAACRDYHVRAVVIGMLEVDGDKLYNAAVLVGPEGVIGSYRKVHLPYLGIDRFTDYGDRPFEVFDVGGVKVGMLICYDSGFPEASRVLALQGVELIVLPTNWPPGAECMSEHSIPSRAMENSVYFLAVDRIGTEQGYRFIGNSSICDPAGNRLAAAMHADEALLIAEIDPARARNKRIVRIPEKHLIDRIADRRPEFYQLLVEPHQLRTPRQDQQQRQSS